MWKGDKMVRSEILDKAKEIVCGNREREYGSPENSFEAIAGLWNAYLSAGSRIPGNFEIDEVDVAVMMALLKIARIATGTFKEDSYIDACGYLACGAELDIKILEAITGVTT